MFALGVFNLGEGRVPHIHPQSEGVYYVTSGRGTVYVGEEKKETAMEADMALYIPPATVLAVRNTGEEKLVMAFFVAPSKEPSKVISIRPASISIIQKEVPVLAGCSPISSSPWQVTANPDNFMWFLLIQRKASRIEGV